MSFCTNNTIEMMMTLNSFGPRFDPQSIPPYNDWVVNNTFNPFGPDPPAATLYPLHFQTRGEFRIENGVDVSSCVDRGHGFKREDMTRDFPQEVSSDPPSGNHELETNGTTPQRSRFAFAQRRIERPTDVNVNQIPAAHVQHSPVDRSRIPKPIKATPTTRVPRVVGPRPCRSQRPFRARRESTMAVPKAVHPLPTWVTHFEVYENEFLAEFCPPSKDSSPSTSSFPAVVGVEPPSEHLPECPPLGTVPLVGFADSDSDSDSDYTGTEVGDWFSEEDKVFDEEDEDHDPFEFNTDSDFGSDCVPLRSESSAPASCAGAFDWPAPYQGQVTDGEGYSRASPVTHLELPPQGLSSLPSSGPHAPSLDPFDLEAQPPDSLPWSVFTDPFTGAPITMPPSRPSVTSVSTYDSADGCVAEVDADQFLAEMEEGLGFGSGSGLIPDSFEANSEGWYDQDSVAAGLGAPPLVYTTTIPLPDAEQVEDVELDAVVIIPRSPELW